MREHPQVREACLSIYSMLRGFLNAMSAMEVAHDNNNSNFMLGSSEDCAELFFCEGALEAAKRGEVGRVVAEVSR